MKSSRGITPRNAEDLVRQDPAEVALSTYSSRSVVISAFHLADHRRVGERIEIGERLEIHAIGRAVEEERPT
jgi:hypothetical protein